MVGRMHDKVALITGGASGIGRGCALRFAEEGAAVMVADINADRAAAVADEVTAAGGSAAVAVVDTSSEEQVAAMVASTLEEFGRVDACVAAAGIPYSAYVSREREEQGSADSREDGDLFLIDKPLANWQKVLDVNLTGVMLTNQHVARAMRDAGTGGAIVNIASLSSKHATLASSDYCVSKAGVWMLTKCGAMELGRYGIRVNAVGPGYTRTSMSGEFETDEWIASHERATPLGRFGEPIDIANPCLYLCSDEASFVTGEIIFPDGGFMAYTR